MSDAVIQVPTEGTGPRLDCEQQTRNSMAVLAQRVQTYYPAQIQLSFTRPANVTAYAAGDAVANSDAAPTALSFSSIGRFAGGGGIIVGGIMISSANKATKGSFELWLFNGSAAPGLDNDNAVFTPTDAELLELVGIIKFLDTNAFVGDATADTGNVVHVGTVLSSPSFEMPYRCHSTIDDLWAAVVVRNAYTPVSAETFTFRLEVKQE
jgi:hypothetical protein